MLGMRIQRVASIILISALVWMCISPLLVSANTTDLTVTKAGPYVNKLVFKVITGADQEVLKLQNNEIDLIGEMVDPVHLDELLSTPNIAVAHTPRNGYGYVTIKTDKYPFNYTAFRRALAFALDKEKISDEVWEGLSEPQDSCVPKVNPWTIEGQLDYTYYEANIPVAEQLLDAAGFIDVDGDGWREGPHGDPFTVTVECAQTSAIATQVGTIVADALKSIKINAVAKPTDFYEYLNRLYFHGDYDIVFLGASFGSFDVDWLAYEYWSENADEPYYNFPCWRNSTYDSWREQLLHSTDYDEVYEAAIEMQRIWVHACPMIICYENILLSAYRTDVFTGHVNSVFGGVPNWWTSYKVHLKSGQMGGTFRWSNPLDVDTFNFMVSSSAYTNNVLNNMYDSLITIGPDGSDIMWLAESYTAETHADNPAVPEGHTRFTFNIIQNATWTDGTPLTAEDVAFSLNYFRNAPGNPYRQDLLDMTAAYAPTPYTVVVEFSTESYWHLHAVSYKPVIQKAFYSNIGLENWNKYNPKPPVDAMVTSGPFNISEYVKGEFCELTRNPNYFYRPTAAPTTTTTTGGTNTVIITVPFDMTLAAVSGSISAVVVILVGGFIVFRRK